MNEPRAVLTVFFLVVLNVAFGQSEESSIDGTETGKLMVRMAEIEILPDFIDKYKELLKEESEASVRLEPGVICIYPMYRKDNPMQIRLLEIYADSQAYQSHLRTPHFKYYKTSTLKMVKSLELIDMEPIAPESMPILFQKMKLY